MLVLRLSYILVVQLVLKACSTCSCSVIDVNPDDLTLTLLIFFFFFFWYSAVPEKQQVNDSHHFAGGSLR